MLLCEEAEERLQFPERSAGKVRTDSWPRPSGRREQERSINGGRTWLLWRHGFPFRLGPGYLCAGEDTGGAAGRRDQRWHRDPRLQVRGAAYVTGHVTRGLPVSPGFWGPGDL